MDRKKLLIRLALLIFFIFAANYSAMKFYLYSSLWWFDMLMHFLGGFWLGLVFLWLFLKENSSFPFSFTLVFKVILGVLLVGISWEIFEIIVNNFSTKNPFDNLDTISDIFFDIAGGLLATFYFFKRIQKHV